MKELIDKQINEVFLLSMCMCSVGLSQAGAELDLHGEYKEYVNSPHGCSGYTGVCSCLNNPCMICSNAH